MRREVGKAQFLKLHVLGMTVLDIADVIGVAPHTLYNWRNDDADFARNWRFAHMAYMETLRIEAVRRAVEGVEEPILKNGVPVLDPRTGRAFATRKYSDRLLEFLMKAGDPETYCDKVRAAKWLAAEHERLSRAAGGQAVEINPELIKLLEDAAGAKTMYGKQLAAQAADADNE